MIFFVRVAEVRNSKEAGVWRNLDSIGWVVHMKVVSGRRAQGRAWSFEMLKEGGLKKKIGFPIFFFFFGYKTE